MLSAHSRIYTEHQWHPPPPPFVDADTASSSAFPRCSCLAVSCMAASYVHIGSTVNGSIMLTASHMPYQNNGMKFFTAQGGLAKPDITEILNTAAQRAAAAGIELGDVMQVNSVRV